MDRYRIGVDLGGTKTEAVLLDGQSRIARRERVPTPGDYAGIVGAITSLVERAADGLPGGLGSVDGIGVCTPGTEYGPDRLIANSNTPSLRDRPLRRDIREALRRDDVAIENDANCFALAESVMGAGSGYDVVFGVIMGTGVGGGIVIGRGIHRGASGIAGEWGHHTLHAGGNRCYCGRNGCVETYLSGPALESRWAQLTGRAAGMPQISGYVTRDGGIADGARGYEGAREWLEEAVGNFGLALANVVDILDPDAIVMGGGLSNMDVWYGAGAESVRKNVFSSLASDVPILRNRLGDSAGVIGACLI